MNVDIDGRDNHPFVAIMALPKERLSFLMSKDFSKRKIRRRGLRLVELTPRREYAIHDHKMCIGIGLCALGIIFIAKANDLAIIVNDSILGHDGSFCIANWTQCAARMAAIWKFRKYFIGQDV